MEIKTLLGVCYRGVRCYPYTVLDRAIALNVARHLGAAPVESCALLLSSGCSAKATHAARFWPLDPALP